MVYSLKSTGNNIDAPKGTSVAHIKRKTHQWTHQHQNSKLLQAPHDHLSKPIIIKSRHHICAARIRPTSSYDLHCRPCSAASVATAWASDESRYWPWSTSSIAINIHFALILLPGENVSMLVVVTFYIRSAKCTSSNDCRYFCSVP